MKLENIVTSDSPPRRGRQEWRTPYSTRSPPPRWPSCSPSGTWTRISITFKTFQTFLNRRDNFMSCKNALKFESLLNPFCHSGQCLKWWDQNTIRYQPQFLTEMNPSAGTRPHGRRGALWAFIGVQARVASILGRTEMRFAFNTKSCNLPFQAGHDNRGAVFILPWSCLYGGLLPVAAPRWSDAQQDSEGLNLLRQ